MVYLNSLEEMRDVEKWVASIHRKEQKAYIPIEIELGGGIAAGYTTDITKATNCNTYLSNMYKSVDEKGISNIMDKLLAVGSRVSICSSIYVEEDLRNEGLGCELLEAFEEEAFDNVSELILLVADTSEENAFDLVKWYERNEYKIIYGERTNYPLMIKTL